MKGFRWRSWRRHWLRQRLAGCMCFRRWKNATHLPAANLDPTPLALTESQSMLLRYLPCHHCGSEFWTEPLLLCALWPWKMKSFRPGMYGGLQIGMVIGPGGKTIRMLRDESGCEIQVRKAIRNTAQLRIESYLGSGVKQGSKFKYYCLTDWWCGECSWLMNWMTRASLKSLEPQRRAWKVPRS